MGHYEDYWTRDDFVADADAAHSALAEENARLREEVARWKDIAKPFIAIHAVEYAKAFSLPKGHLMPEHYDLLGEAGARLSDFTRAKPPTRPADADPDISGVPV